MTVRNYTYTINATSSGWEIWGKDGINEIPFLYQPFNPDNNSPWVSEAEAKAWSDAQISMLVARDLSPSASSDKASGHAKLEALGLTLAEIAAL
jgi:hypothetical protein